ncbi:hypothetical protein FKW77_001993 [Venturia effusa]|uniref:Chromate ion transporter n=1 Tax=Venturia effusa TaxID=50376 RepID=A0A517L8Q7_9PEZI|nr:hypothetical protein FKW77_001993 [Venturia effusa]
MSWSSLYHALGERLLDASLRTWDLGFTGFGGPPVHFRIIHQRFVEGMGLRGGKRAPWIDEQTYQELFAICSALPGPGSTKMLFCVVLIHAGYIPAIFVFLTWSLPGANGMFALSLGVQRITNTLPGPVYALLSGLNSSTVGIIALAAVQLAEKAIKDKLTRILVIGGACAVMCFNALWYLPFLMVVGGTVALIWDLWAHQQVGKARARMARKRGSNETGLTNQGQALELPHHQLGDTVNDANVSSSDGLQRRSVQTPSIHLPAEIPTPAQPGVDATNLCAKDNECEAVAMADTITHAISVKAGLSIIAVFFASFIAVLVARGTLKPPPLPLAVFTSMYLAGTIIFGGGPVVIPLLREIVVQPGWVSSRDFLIGLAIIQAFPGPNFNFAVYLGALSLQASTWPVTLGAFLGYAGIFVPGISLAVGIQSIWRVIRSKPAVISLLWGVNATAVGLVFTAVYRLWEIGYLTKGAIDGQSLAKEP